MGRVPRPILLGITYRLRRLIVTTASTKSGLRWSEETSAPYLLCVSSFLDTHLTLFLLDDDQIKQIEEGAYKPLNVE